MTIPKSQFTVTHIYFFFMIDVSGYEATSMALPQAFSFQIPASKSGPYLGHPKI